MKKLIIFLFLFALLPITQVSASGELIKGENYNAVYYKASDGQRYIFPNAKIYNSWYDNFSGVTTISDTELSEIPLGGNVFYKPNSRLIKIKTVPEVYWVDEFGFLRHIVSEKTAQDLFGSQWFNLVDDLPEEYFLGYTVGTAIDSSFSISINEDWQINDNKLLTQRSLSLKEQEILVEEEDEVINNEPEEIVDVEDQPESINLTVTNNDQDITLEWSVTGGNTNYGFAIVKSETENPTHPEDDYKLDLNEDSTQYIWNDVQGNKAFYFRICRLNSDDSCGTYSDQETVATGVTEKTQALVLSGEIENGIVKLAWETEWLSIDDGYYLLRGPQENPKYKSTTGLWLEKENENYDWEGLSNGIHHFRICKYTGLTLDGCVNYSNNLELTIE